jgi:hypothetical protein
MPLHFSNMNCPSCEILRGMAQHTTAQAKSIREGRGCSSGGRDMCKICWSNGPTEDDFVDLDNNLHFWILDKDTHRTDMVDFMVEFARYVSSGDNHRKLWSHWGVLWSRLSSDPREKFQWTRRPASQADTIAGGQWTFDPTNPGTGTGTGTTSNYWKYLVVISSNSCIMSSISVS